MVVEKAHHFFTLLLFFNPLYTLKFLNPFITIPLASSAGKARQSLGQRSEIRSCFETILLAAACYHA